MPSLVRSGRALLAIAGLWLALPAAAAESLTIDRILAEPSITGTSPTSPAWSPDGARLAFLWNDGGGLARQLWLTDRRGSAPVPLTGPRDGAVAGFAWTPDGERILFLANDALHAIAATGGDAVELAGPGNGRAALSVSPDGRYAAWLEGGDLWRLRLAGGAPERLTNVGVPGISRVAVGQYSRPEVEIGPGIWGGPTYAWSPDGRRIAVHHVDRRHLRKVPFPWYLDEETDPNFVRRGYPGDPNETRTVGLVDVSTGRLELLALPDPTANQVVGFEWSSRGELLIDRASDTNVDRWLDVVDPATGTRREAWHGHRATRVYTAFSSAWHPDGEHILFSSDREDRYGLYRLDPASGELRRLTQPGHDLLGDFTVLGSSGSVIYEANDPSPYERQVFAVDADGGTPTRLTFAAGSNEAFPSPDGEVIAFIHSDDSSPAELWLAPAGSRNANRLTVSPPGEFRAREWADVRYASFPSQVDDYQLHARIMTPPDFDAERRYPVVFGPLYSNTVRNGWSGRFGLIQQLFVDRGYVVVQVDMRGSTGYGREFREAFLTDFAGGDVEDVASAAAYMSSLPWVDSDRLGLWGSSYGGTLTVFSLLKKPGLYRAGVAAAAAVDARSFGPDDIAIVRYPDTHPAIFERTALSYAANLEDHLLFIHGLQDQVVPFKTTAVLAEELMRHGKDFEFAFAPGASHRWTRESHHAHYLLGRMFAHFNRYLDP